ncbi:hypothetical protein B0E46_14280 [Rhodanobacter sp. B04]|nr:hypothetical protein B0E46_14280 [Rhodanobacter sp. B04]
MSPKVAADQAAQMAEVAKIETDENALNVGQTLPSGLLVKDGEGRDIDLRSAIHGPTVLLKVAMDCRPCIESMEWLRKNASSYEKTQHASIIVLAIRSKALPPGTLPAEVRVLYTPDDLSSGFLGGTLTPAEFLFDGQGRMVARRAGYSADLLTKISFPSELK